MHQISFIESKLLNQRWVIFAALAVLVGLTSIRLSWLAQVQSRDVDEVPWIVSSVYYTDLVLSGDFTSPAWEGESLGLYGSINPHLGQLWIGGWLRICPATKRLSITPSESYRLTHNLFETAEPTISPQVVRVARYAHAAMGVICVVLLFILVTRISGTAVGFVTALACSFSPAFTDVFSRVFTDGVYNAGLLLSTIALLEFVRARHVKTAAAWAAIAGASIGVAYNAKMTALLLGLPCLVIAAVVRLRHTTESRKHATWLVGTSLAASLFVSYLGNPYLWPTASAPVGGGTLRVFERASIAPPGDVEPSRSHGPVATRILESQLRWSRHMPRQLEYLVSHFGYRPATWQDVVRRCIFTYNHRYVGCICILATVAGLAFLAIQTPRTSFAVSMQVLAGTAFVHMCFLLVFLRLDWSRYYLPVTFHLHALEGGAIAFLVTRLWESRKPATEINRSVDDATNRSIHPTLQP